MLLEFAMIGAHVYFVIRLILLQQFINMQEKKINKIE